MQTHGLLDSDGGFINPFDAKVSGNKSETLIVDHLLKSNSKSFFVLTTFWVPVFVSDHSHKITFCRHHACLGQKWISWIKFFDKFIWIVCSNSTQLWQWDRFFLQNNHINIQLNSIIRNQNTMKMVIKYIFCTILTFLIFFKCQILTGRIQYLKGHFCLKNTPKIVSGLEQKLVKRHKIIVYIIIIDCCCDFHHHITLTKTTGCQALQTIVLDTLY